jgi:hypothetical protein
VPTKSTNNGIALIGYAPTINNPIWIIALFLDGRKIGALE